MPLPLTDLCAAKPQLHGVILCPRDGGTSRLLFTLQLGINEQAKCSEMKINHIAQRFLQ